MPFLSALASMAVLATPPAGVSDPVVGRTLHYERSNIAGGEEEQIYVHRAAADRIEVYKMRARCTGAAFVAATIDPATGVATRLDAGRLAPEGRHRMFGVMRWDAAASHLSIEVTLGGQTIREQVPGSAPWHLYDYDLATLMAALEARGPSREPLRFDLALVWTEAPPFLRWLGTAEARFERAETHLGRAALRFMVTGAAFGDGGGGPMWIDAADGRLIDVQWGRPNHSGYRDFRLRLVGEAARDAAGWQALLRRHYEGCPPA